MRYFVASLYLILTSSLSLPAQVDSVYLDADFVFQNGIYLSLEQLHQNQPAYEWKEEIGRASCRERV